MAYGPLGRENSSRTGCELQPLPGRVSLPKGGRIPMARLFRSMKEEPGGVHERAAHARALGVRPGVDVPATQEDLVLPGQGEVSVSPDDPLNLPYFRRPPEFQGTGRDPVWSIEDSQL